ncbi:MAG: dihydrolipoamide acetyltransferase family protein [Cytophagales bacterium]|nr:dihydrolipoamide acetyltransferase family protein [Cytophagales bacterium]
MATIELLMPKMGESVMEGTVLSWLKSKGDSVDEDEAILEVATDKVDTEIPSTHAGIIKEILAEEGEVIQVGKPIAIIETEGEESSDAAADAPAPETSTVEAASSLLNQAIAEHSAATEHIPASSDSGRFYSPLVRNMAKEESISLLELEAIVGTGKDGRVTKHDMLAYIDTRKKGNGAPVTAPAAVPAKSNGTAAPTVERNIQAVPAVIDGQDEIIEMDRMRKMIAERMVASKAISPHVTSFVEADVTNLVKWRNQKKNLVKERDGEALTFTPIMIEAVVKAIKDYPMINVQVDGNNIVKKSAINIGMAVALPTGNLIVPVIHHADQLNVLGLTKRVNDLARRARENKLKPDELSGGTYTVSNVGSFGNVMGTPIIMQPQVGILALGAIQKKPAVVETPEGDFIGIRHKMFLSHSYDHRVVDGALGGMFVRRVADYLERFDLNTDI